MCGIIGNEVLLHMSAVIGVCGTNFCTFWADGRMVSNSDGVIGVTSDHVQKIFKLNTHVLFGAAGWFDHRENIESAILNINDVDHVSVNTVQNAVVSYMETHTDILSKVKVRNYLVGGKMDNGKFIIYEIRWNNECKKIEVVERLPIPPASAYGISMMLPNASHEVHQHFLNRVATAISDSISLEQLIPKVADVIAAISTVDATVGKYVMQFTVT